MEDIQIIRLPEKDLYKDNKYKFVEVFDKKSGFYIRSGVINENNVETEKDPFMRSFPGLIDIGIMGHCDHGRSGLCVKAGVQCYQNGLTVYEPNMTLEDYTEIMKQSQGKVQQVALGGRGDPNKHEEFGEILKITREFGIMPNYTTSGLGLTDKEVELTKKYCGAAAVSWYRSQYTLDAIKRFVDAGVLTSIHYVLSNSSIDEAIERLENKDFPNGINAVIFLLHKPVGLGKKDEMLSINDKRVEKFFSMVDGWDGNFKIGFDSCSIPGILNLTKSVSLASVDTCEGSRFSAYITHDMIMTTCSFDEKLKYGVSLRDHTLKEAWNSPEFNAFRDKLSNRCPGCSIREHCKGGCPLKPEIVLCDSKDKKQ